MAPPEEPRPAAGARRRAVLAPPIVDYAVEAYGLRKVYRNRTGKQAAVDGLDLRVPVGGIHGFLGPNGSGKQPRSECFSDWSQQTPATSEIFDHEVPLAIDEVIGRVGAIVEQPRFFPRFSGQKNLKLLAKAIVHRADELPRCSTKWNWRAATNTATTHLA
ncbi:MAG TPA: hypothetical protein VJ820_16240 [Propionibacteriaceae bacterium]|nr:hypothetical protein [Propionibacteriaceae bacterium]